MVNLALTATCNRQCGYCFATGRGAAPAAVDTMSMATFEACLQILERAGMDEVRLLGGEPTLHPDFSRILDRVVERGWRLLVFTGGLVPEPALERLAAIEPTRLRVLVNVLDPRHGRAAEVRRQAELFQRLGPRVVLGLNIPSPAVQFDFLLDLIERYGLARTVRLGISHPVLDGENDALHPRHYREVGRRVTSFGERARAAAVELEFDCGWVPCMFPEGALEFLGKGPMDVGLRCNPILDVLPDGSVIGCFPLASHARAYLTPAPTAATLRAELAARQAVDRSFMLFRECEACTWRARGACTGGCLSASLRRRRSATPTPAASSATEVSPS